MKEKRHTRLIQSMKAFPRIASVTAIIVGTTVIIGWIFDIPLLKSLYPSLVSMKANTALAFVLAGISLLLLSSQGEGKQKVTARFLAFVVFLIGLLTILQYAFTWDAGIDQLLFDEPQGTVGTFSPGRMALNTAISFSLLGLTLVIIRGRNRRDEALAQTAALVVALFSLLVLITYTYGFSGFIGMSVYTRMALHTAVTFLLLSVGLLCLQPDAGIIAVVSGEGSAGYMARRLMLAALGMPVIIGWLVIHGEMMGMYDNQFGDAIGATAYIGIFVYLVWTIGRTLIKMDVERKRVERVLESEHALLSALINSPSEIIIFSLDKNYCYTTFNEKHREEMKRVWNVEIKIGMNLLDCMSILELRELAKQSMDRVLKGEAFLEEQHQPELDIYYEFSWNPIFQQNEIGGITVFVRDITERKRMEEVLRKSEKRLREAQEMAHLGFWTWDMKTGEVEWSKEVFKIFCLNPNEFTPRIDSILALSPWPEDHHRDQELIKKAIETHNPGSYEQRFLRPDNSIGHYYSTFQGNYNEKGDLISIVGTVLDITERKAADEVIKNMELLLNETQEITKVGGWEYDVAKGKVTWTDEVYRIYGVSKEYDPGNPDQDISFYAPDDQRKLDTAFKRAVEIGEPYDLDLQLFNAAGMKLWVRTRGKAEKRDGKIDRVYGNIMDITDRKQAEEEIYSLNAELEQKVLLRTAELEASNKELEAFSYSVSHDLRAPLRHINGYVDLLSKNWEGTLTEKAKHYLDTIVDSAHQMGTLIDDLLKFSRTGRLEMHETTVDMNVMVKEVTKQLQEDFPQRNIEWTIAQLPSIHCDPKMLRLVWENLLGNAVKFTRIRTRAEIEIGSREEENEFVFFVRDNGAGFDMKYAKKLFGVFQRMHRADEFEGTGVGLANVHRIISRHGGRTWAEAEIDKGATLYFTLPIEQEKTL